LPKYDAANHNVQSVKLDVLRLTFLSPRHPNEDQIDDADDPEASNKVPSDINSFFPFTLRFLDLSTLGLKDVPERLPWPLFLREEYDHISALIEKGPRNTRGSVINQLADIKVRYLHLRVIQSMIEGRPLLYQTWNRTVYHVNESGVQAIRSWSSTEDHIVAFVDGDVNDSRPELMLS